MDETLKRRIVGIGVISLIILVVAWWLPDHDDGQKRLNPERLPTETRVYDIHALDQGQDGEVEPSAAEAASPPIIDGDFGQVLSADAEPVAVEDAGEPADAPPAPVIKPAPVTTAAPQQAPATASTQPAKPAVKPAPVAKAAEPAPKPAEKPAAAKPAAPAQVLPAGGWLVQVGSYAEQANADSMRKKIEAKGYRVMVTTAQVSGKSYHRVRVGPYPAKADAQDAANNLQKILGQKVAVMPNN